MKAKPVRYSIAGQYEVSNEPSKGLKDMPSDVAVITGYHTIHLAELRKPETSKRKILMQGTLTPNKKRDL
ncbi:hypothetical protein EOD39_10241 [Acipenser ruthenus]|uniref:Uncharacterized protein n=1 Tax=Acipenser ruthenus TaxID=7906 RepID=A0A662YU23_ACIRT|nr:hypothetical protein EOD39_10241 [Acipenser ruthenus]